MKTKEQLVREADFIVDELQKAFQRCQKKSIDDSFIAHISLSHFIELILANEGMKALDNGIERAKEAYEILYDTSDDGGVQ